jgi:hypothetical protein
MIICAPAEELTLELPGNLFQPSERDKRFPAPRLLQSNTVRRKPSANHNVLHYSTAEIGEWIEGVSRINASRSTSVLTTFREPGVKVVA